MPVFIGLKALFMGKNGLKKLESRVLRSKLGRKWVLSGFQVLIKPFLIVKIGFEPINSGASSY